MSKHKDKLESMKVAGDNLNKQWEKNKVTPEKNEEWMKEAIQKLIPKNRKRGFSLFR